VDFKEGDLISYKELNSHASGVWIYMGPYCFELKGKCKGKSLIDGCEIVMTLRLIRLATSEEIADSIARRMTI
jgi:hypothetical protein